MQLFQMNSPPSDALDTISDLFARVTDSGIISLAEQHQLSVALMIDALTDEEECAIQRLFYLVRQGKVQVIPSRIFPDNSNLVN